MSYQSMDLCIAQHCLELKAQELKTYIFTHLHTEGCSAVNFEEILVIVQKTLGDAELTLIYKNGFTEDEKHLKSSEIKVTKHRWSGTRPVNYCAISKSDHSVENWVLPLVQSRGYICFFAPEVAPSFLLLLWLSDSGSPTFPFLSAMRMTKVVFSYFSAVQAP